jgi:hypothetical protein
MLTMIHFPLFSLPLFMFQVSAWLLGGMYELLVSLRYVYV